jgi:hypothetical protein
MDHPCHAVDCKTQVHPRFLMCPRHWGMVSARTKRLVWSTYRKGQEVDKRPSREYLAASSAAIVEVARKEGKPIERRSTVAISPLHGADPDAARPMPSQESICEDCGRELSGGRCPMAPGFDVRCSTWITSAWSFTWLLPDEIQGFHASQRSSRDMGPSFDPASPQTQLLALVCDQVQAMKRIEGYLVVPMALDDPRFPVGVERAVAALRTQYEAVEVLDPAKGVVAMSTPEGARLTRHVRFILLEARGQISLEGAR